LTHATEQKILPQQGEISGIIVAYDNELDRKQTITLYRHNLHLLNLNKVLIALTMIMKTQLTMSSLVIKHPAAQLHTQTRQRCVDSVVLYSIESGFHSFRTEPLWPFISQRKYCVKGAADEFNILYPATLKPCILLRQLL